MKGFRPPRASMFMQRREARWGSKSALHTSSPSLSPFLLFSYNSPASGACALDMVISDGQGITEFRDKSRRIKDYLVLGQVSKLKVAAGRFSS